MKIVEIQEQIRAHLSPLGNWCGHNPTQPKFFIPPEEHGTRPDVLVIASENLERFYWTPKQYLLSLMESRDSSRQERTEARERDASVLQALCHHLELATMKVGVPLKDGGFWSISEKHIALKLGWRKPEDDDDPKHKNRGLKRVNRALKSLKKAGYITITRRCQKTFDEEQEYRGLPAIRCVTAKLFRELKINLQCLKKRRKQAGERIKKKYKEYIHTLEEKAKYKFNEAVQGILQFHKNLRGEIPVKSKRLGLAHGIAALAKLEAKLQKEGYFDTS
jgi:hypothetical protein